jgi:hypothetical protein
MTAATIIGVANFFVKGRKASMVLIGMQLVYLAYKYQKDKNSQPKQVSN